MPTLPASALPSTQRCSALLVMVLALLAQALLLVPVSQLAQAPLAAWQPLALSAQGEDAPPGPQPADDDQGLAIEASGENGNPGEDNDPHRGGQRSRQGTLPPAHSTAITLRVAGLPVPDPRLRLNQANAPPRA